MRKQLVIFLLLFVPLTGGFLSLNAQSINVWVESETSGGLLEGCTLKLVVELLDLPTKNIQTPVSISCTGAAEYTNLPELADLINGSAEISFLVTDMPTSAHGTSGSITVSLKNQPELKKEITYIFYNTPAYKVVYARPTSLYSGKLELNIKGGSPYMLRQWKSGGLPVDARTPFSESEIANSSEGDILLLWEPNSCWRESITLVSNASEGTNPGGSISRWVTVPMLTNAETDPVAGLYTVASGSDFIFVIKPHMENGVYPVVTTDRSIPDEEGVKIEQKDDGSYSVTIFRVQTTTNINISIPAGNKLLSGANVWTDGGKLYLSSVTDEKANIYNIAGQLLQVVTCSAGEIIDIALSKGLYLVTLNNQGYKVYIR